MKRSDCVFGMMFRRFRARMDNRQATVATAHAIARVVYRMLKYKVEYEAINVAEYERKFEEQQIKYMKKTCTEPVEVKPRNSASNSSPSKPEPDRDEKEKASSIENARFAFNRLCDFY